MKSWYRFENKSSDVTDLYIYDEISKWSVNASDFVRDLSAVKSKVINLYINSPGGNVFDGVTIYNALKRHSATINVYIDGLAASIASVIAMAGDTVDIAKNAMMMVHRAWSIQVGNMNDMQEMAGVLDKIDTGTIISSYSEKTGLKDSEIVDLIDAETWLTAQEARDYGFVDSIGGETDAKASFDLSKFKNVPPAALARFAAKHEKTQATERDMEHLLRDAGGLSISQAKAAVQFVKNLRDAGDSEETEAEKFRQYMQIELLKSAMQ